mmetsp:Transcript_23158/g.68356  ORF Transcript_23158/g.68356 Transcript_23158/m.68356 type:complete len:229 (+) Transcript_23158:954-1640(+)
MPTFSAYVCAISVPSNAVPCPAGWNPSSAKKSSTRRFFSSYESSSKESKSGCAEEASSPSPTLPRTSSTSGTVATTMSLPPAYSSRISSTSSSMAPRSARPLHPDTALSGYGRKGMREKSGSPSNRVWHSPLSLARTPVAPDSLAAPRTARRRLRTSSPNRAAEWPLRTLFTPHDTTAASTRRRRLFPSPPPPPPPPPPGHPAKTSRRSGTISLSIPSAVSPDLPKDQ